MRAGWLSSLLMWAGCGGSLSAPTSGAGGSSAAGTRGTAGTNGASGGAGTFGLSGTAGSSAGVGFAGTGGGAAHPGPGGTGGWSGGVLGVAGASSGPPFPGSAAECATAADCVLYSDCCACRSESRRATVHSCGGTCKVDACTMMGIQPQEVTCAFGRCVIARSCDTRRVTCAETPSECPPGGVHAVVDSCWGPCMSPTECAEVADCSACGSSLVCVQNTELGGRTTGCVTPDPDCQAGSYCGCLHACIAECSEVGATVSCACSGC